MFNLKRKVKNKARVEALIYKTYNVEEISTFILYYFKPHLRTRINYVPRHDEDREVPSNENLSNNLDMHLGRPIPKNNVSGRYYKKLNSNMQIIIYYLTMIN